MNNVCVIGTTGQDGSYLSEYLLKLGYCVFGVARRCGHDNTENIKDILDHPKFTLIEGDVTDYSSMLNLIKEYYPHFIFNLSAQSHVGVSFNQPLYTLNVNGQGVINLLEIIKFLQTKSYKPRFLQCSTSELFGDQYDVDKGVKYQDENTKMNPQSPYAIAKLVAYHAVKLYRKSYGIFACNSIMYNHESERRGKQFLTKKVAEYVGQLYHNPTNYTKLRLGNLLAYRDWGYSPEYVQVMLKMLQQDKPDDYVVGTGESYSVKEFVQEAFNCINLNYEDYVEINKNFIRPSEVPYLQCRATKAKQVLEFNPQVKFKELVKIMVQHEIDHYTN